MNKPIEQEKRIFYTFKTVIIGAQSVGKTCLFNRFCFNSFNFDTSLTIGINFHSLNLKVKQQDQMDMLGEKYIVNSIFDFGGQERFKPLLPKFLEGANGALLVFDLVNKKTFAQLDFWYDQLIEHANGYYIPKILVGSKFDLVGSIPKEDRVEDNAINQFVEENKLEGFYKTSALENYNVVQVFKELSNLMLKKQNSNFIVSE
ncbi:MAG: Rab family GTPase [Candidatus Hermodarchaeota archaeon]